MIIFFKKNGKVADTERGCTVFVAVKRTISGHQESKKTLPIGSGSFYMTVEISPITLVSLSYSEEAPGEIMTHHLCTHCG